MILIFNLKRKRLFRILFGSDIYVGTKRVRFFVNLAEARKSNFASQNPSVPPRSEKIGFAFKEEFEKVLAFLRRRRRRQRILIFKF